MMMLMMTTSEPFVFLFVTLKEATTEKRLIVACLWDATSYGMINFWFTDFGREDAKGT